MKTDFVSLVEKELSDLFKLEKQKAPTKESKLLITRIAKLVMRGGKRFRPQLLALSYSAYGGKDSNKLIDLAVALELHHQFLLAHDDIIDQDNVRYSGPNIAGYYKKDGMQGNTPESMALLAGDLLFSLVSQLVLNSSSYSESQKIELVGLLNETTQTAIYGQQLDIFNVDMDAKSTNRFELISTLKTAAYSVRLPMQSAAILLSLPKKERDKIDDFALRFGTLFQLADDYSDYFDNDSVFNNRPKYRDLAQGKITYPMHFGFKLAKGKDLAFLKQALGNKKVTDKDIKKVLDTLENCGAKTKSQQFVELHLKPTYKVLGKLSISVDSKKTFKNMIDNYSV